MLWNINCTDNFNNIGNSSRRYIDTQIGSRPPNTGEGGGGGVSLINFTLVLEDVNLSKKLCNITKKYIDNYGNNYLHVIDIQEEFIRETNESILPSDVMGYIDNFQFLCLGLVNITLDLDFVCKKIYFFIIENGWDYTEEDFEILSKEINKRIGLNESLIDYYIDKHYELCYKKNYSDALPRKPIRILTLFDYFNFTKCSTELGNSLLDSYIPLPNMNVGEIDCQRIDMLRLFLKIKESSRNDDDKGIYEIIGFKIWIILLLLLSIILIFKVGKIFIFKVGKIYKRLEKFSK